MIVLSCSLYSILFKIQESNFFGDGCLGSGGPSGCAAAQQVRAVVLLPVLPSLKLPSRYDGHVPLYRGEKAFGTVQDNMLHTIKTECLW